MLSIGMVIYFIILYDIKLFSTVLYHIIQWWILYNVVMLDFISCVGDQLLGLEMWLPPFKYFTIKMTPFS